MILVVVGSSTIPFDRLVQGAAALGRDDVLVQHGASRPPAGVEAVEYVPFERLVELVRAARVVVTHGGVGSILVALGEGKRPVVCPRLARHREAVDDHQLELARRLARDGLVSVVEDVALLGDAIARADGVGTHGVGPGSLGRALRARIDAELQAVER